MCDRYALFGPKKSIRKIEDEPRHRYRLFKSFCSGNQLIPNGWD